MKLVVDELSACALACAVVFSGIVLKDLSHLTPFTQCKIGCVLLRPFRPFIEKKHFLTEEELVANRRKLPLLKFICLASSACAIAVLWLVELVNAIRNPGPNSQSAPLQIEFAFSAAWLYLLLRVLLLRRAPTPQYGLCMFSMGQIAVSSSIGLADILVAEARLRLLRAIFAGAILLISLTQPIDDVTVAANVPPRGAALSGDNTTPDNSANLFDWLTCSFLTPLINAGNLRTLKVSDLWVVSPYMRASTIYERFKKYRESKILWRLASANSMDMIVDGLTHTIAAVAQLAPAFFTKRVLEAIERHDERTGADVLKWAIIAAVCGCFEDCASQLSNAHSARAFVRVAVSLRCSIFEKALKRQDLGGQMAQRYDDKGLPTQAEDAKNASTGRVVGLMSSDANQLADSLSYLFMAAQIPITLAASIAFMYSIVGKAAAAAFVVVAIAVPISNQLLRLNQAIAKQYKEAQDVRVTETNTYLRAIRFVRANDWQNRWTGRILEARDAELALLNRQRIQGLLLGLVWTTTPLLIVLATFYVYTQVLGHKLTVAVAFSAIALSDAVSQPLYQVPTLVEQITIALESARRIDQFLAEPEVESRTCALTRGPSAVDKSRVAIHDSRFRWPAPTSDVDESKSVDGETAFELVVKGDVVFPIGLSVITGPTSSGKSALLAALLGEMEQVEGHVELNKDNGNVAFAAQTIWLENNTFRNNVLFHNPMDETRYAQVLDACALKRDLDMWPNGDQTRVGERGITLSGGQQARLALARVLYAPSARALLLDDILSAVDAHTARHLVSNCLSGPLVSDKVIILITHHPELCSSILSTVYSIVDGILSINTTSRKPVNETNAEKVITGAVKEAQEGPVVLDRSKGEDHESIQEGNVKLATYARYIKAVGLWAWVAVLSIKIFAWGTGFVRRWIVKLWTESAPAPHHSKASLVTIRQPLALARPISTTTASSSNADYYFNLIIFTDLLQAVTKTQLQWFNITPMGRILFRFTEDVAKLDTKVASGFGTVASCIVAIVTILVILANLMPSFLLASALFFLFSVLVTLPYLRTSRSLRRLASAAAAPVYSKFSELLLGVQTIRGYAKESIFQDDLLELLDEVNRVRFAFVTGSHWLSLRFAFFFEVIKAFTVWAVWYTDQDAGTAAIVILYTGVIFGQFRALMTEIAVLETDLNSLERVDQYIVDNPFEAPLIVESNRPHLGWPSSSGGIHIENLHARYSKDGPEVLKGLTFEIKPAEKIAIVGRTGAGKSSFSQCLLRFMELDKGSIVIDGINIADIGLSDLRKNICVMAQDAVLFQGTLRENLDPFDEFDTNELLDVLYKCNLMHDGSAPTTAAPSRTASSTNLKGSLNDSAETLVGPTSIVKKRIHLNTHVAESGNNFSAGERQLIALARSLLRRPKILLLDEASSSIDKETDSMLQAFIREAFADSLVICIAHRLASVIDYDRVLCLENGCLAQYAPPKELLAAKSGLFYDLCCASSDKDALFAAVGEKAP